MTAPPAYSSVGDDAEGGADAPPPAYNPNAPSDAPSPVFYGNSPVVQQPAPTVRYVDQYGNPVPAPTGAAPPQPAIRYVDQYGNPVAPPTGATPQQPTVKYVDQYGNPVNPPTQQQPAIRYVDQYGNPVAPPTGASPQPPAQQPAVRYVDQYGNPVAAPTATTVTPASGGMTYKMNNNTYTSAASKSSRITAFVFGMLGFLMILIGFFCDNLARDYVYSGVDGTYTCGFTKLRFRCDDYYSYSYYWSSCTDDEQSWSDLCDTFGDLNGVVDFCATSTAATLTLLCQIAALLLCLLGFIYAQPWGKVSSIGACKNCGRSCLFASLLFSIMALVLWYSVADFCIGENPFDGSSSYWSYSDDFSVGATIVLHIIGMIFNFIAALLARGDDTSSASSQPQAVSGAANAGYPGGPGGVR